MAGPRDGEPPENDDERRYLERAFGGLVTADAELAGANLIACTFEGCDLSEASLKGSQLSDCRFERCELAMLDLTDAIFQGVAFDTCRLVGNHFSTLRQGPLGLSMRFEDCDLSLCSFRQMDLTGCSFLRCRFHEAEFVRCELRGVSFAGSDLGRCAFQGDELVEADLRGATNYVISALDNRIRGMHVTWPESDGLLVALGVDLNGS